MRKIITLLLICMSFASAYSQYSTCYVYDDLTAAERKRLGISDKEFNTHRNKNASTDFNIANANAKNLPQTSKKFRIQLWNVRSSDNTTGAGVSYEMAVKYIKDLNSFYKEHNICFVLTGVGILNDSSVLNGANYTNLKMSGMQNNAYSDNAINVYIAPTIIGGAHGVTSYYSNSIALYEQAMWYEKGLLAHEVGHTLTLMHTHGKYNEPPNGNVGTLSDCEKATRDVNHPNYNATTAGDQVSDTAADPGLFPNTNSPYYNQNTNCEYLGNATDCAGEPYQLDSSVLNNVMAYNHDACKTLLTSGQAQRIHNKIDTADPAFKEVKRALITEDENFQYDLMVRDGQDDYGVEPNTLTQQFWASPDIWVRVNNDQGTDHQNPVYRSIPNYVYVRVVNRGCNESDGTGTIKLYWTKAGTNLLLQAWNGSIQHNGNPMGGFIGEFNLPVMKSYEERIFKFEWTVPNPQLYSNLNEPWHFCLLAKIESPTDASLMPEITNDYYEFLNSNNLALKNVNITNVNYANSGKIHIANFHNTLNHYKIKVKNELQNMNKDIFKEAEIRLEFDDRLWKIWEKNKFSGTNYKRIGERSIIVTENTEIHLLNFPGKTMGLLNVKVNFLTSKYTPNANYGFHIIHEDVTKNKVLGGEYFQVSKNKRSLFSTNYSVSGNTIYADEIDEPAVYNWYDMEGHLLHKGLSYDNKDSKNNVILEITSLSDGFIGYETIFNENSEPSALISSLYPNPASSVLNIDYDIKNCPNAYISIVKVGTSTYDNYIIDANANSIAIDVSSKFPGIYILSVMCNNQIIESHNLKIN